MKTKHPGMCGAPATAYLRWNSLGVSPTSSWNRLLNDPRLENPTAWQTSVTVRFVARSRSWARSIRRSGEVRRGGEAVGGLEQALEVVLADAGHRRQRGQVERLGVVPVGVVAGPAQVDQHVAGAPERGGGGELYRGAGGQPSTELRLAGEPRRSRSRREAITAERRLRRGAGRRWGCDVRADRGGPGPADAARDGGVQLRQAAEELADRERQAGRERADVARDGPRRQVGRHRRAGPAQPDPLADDVRAGGVVAQRLPGELTSAEKNAGAPENA